MSNHLDSKQEEFEDEEAENDEFEDLPTTFNVSSSSDLNCG